MHLASRPRSPAALGFNGEYQERHAVQLLGSYRAYNPVLMRFHNQDSLSPFGKGGLNAYAYCLGDPVNHSDPTGHLALHEWVRAKPVRFAGHTFGFGMILGFVALMVQKKEIKEGLAWTSVALVATSAVLAVTPLLKNVAPDFYRNVGRRLTGRRTYSDRRSQRQNIQTWHERHGNGAADFPSRPIARPRSNDFDLSLTRPPAAPRKNSLPTYWEDSDALPPTYEQAQTLLQEPPLHQGPTLTAATTGSTIRDSGPL